MRFLANRSSSKFIVSVKYRSCIKKISVEVVKQGPCDEVIDETEIEITTEPIKPIPDVEDVDETEMIPDVKFEELHENKYFSSAEKYTITPEFNHYGR